MPKAIFRFYEELNDFLPDNHKKRDFQVDFYGRRSVIDMIVALGIPHTKIDLILINGKSVDFSCILKNGDRVSVYPVFEYLNIRNVTRLRKFPLRKTKFIADANLGNIVKLMRILGFDIYFNPTMSPQQIIERSNKEHRIILTKSRKLLKLKNIKHGIYIHPGTTEKQVKRILDDLDIRDHIRPFSRCLLCNHPLDPVSKSDILDQIPPKTRRFYDDYTRCMHCNKIYWKGTHYLRMKVTIEELLNQPETPSF